MKLMAFPVVTQSLSFIRCVVALVRLSGERGYTPSSPSPPSPPLLFLLLSFLLVVASTVSTVMIDFLLSLVVGADELSVCVLELKE